MLKLWNKKKKVKEPSLNIDNSINLDKTNSEKEDRPLDSPTIVDNMLNDGIHFEKDYFMMKTGLGSTKYGR